jgi:ribosomal protein S18 acetylase RimI-like enzyme
MIMKTSKCSKELLRRAADYAFNTSDFKIDNFDFCTNPAEITKALASSDSWYVHAMNHQTALFKLETSEETATISDICPGDETIETILPNLREELRKLGLSTIALRVAVNSAKSLEASGFDQQTPYVRFSRAPSESKMMPILPLMNATEKGVPLLARLMFDSYAKTDYGFSGIQAAEKSIRKIMSGTLGKYLEHASFVSGTQRNLVSACLVTADSLREAKIKELFTHPLYRARGLATTEIAFAMNSLAEEGVRKLIVWSRESNAIVTRLLAKLGFKEDREVVEVSGPV